MTLIDAPTRNMLCRNHILYLLGRLKPKPQNVTGYFLSTINVKSTTFDMYFCGGFQIKTAQKQVFPLTLLTETYVYYKYTMVIQFFVPTFFKEDGVLY